MAWFRQIGLEFGDVIVKSDNERADELDRVVEQCACDGEVHGRQWAARGATESWTAIQSVQGMVRTIRSSFEEEWREGGRVEEEH